MDKWIFLFCISLLLFGCTQKPADNANNTQPTGELVDDSAITDDLNDLSDLQDSLNDTVLDDSGIDENTFQ